VGVDEWGKTVRRGTPPTPTLPHKGEGEEPRCHMRLPCLPSVPGGSEEAVAGTSLTTAAECDSNDRNRP